MDRLAHARAQTAEAIRAAWDDGWSYRLIAAACGIGANALCFRVAAPRMGLPSPGPPQDSRRRPHVPANPDRPAEDWGDDIRALHQAELDLEQRRKQAAGRLTDLLRAAWHSGWSYGEQAEELGLEGFSRREIQRRAAGEPEAKKQAARKRARRRAARDGGR